MRRRPPAAPRRPEASADPAPLRPRCARSSFDIALYRIVLHVMLCYLVSYYVI